MEGNINQKLASFLAEYLPQLTTIPRCYFQKTISAWQKIFFVTIGLYILEILAYTIFGSGEEQPWNKAEEQKSEDNVETKPLNNDGDKTHL